MAPVSNTEPMWQVFLLSNSARNTSKRATAARRTRDRREQMTEALARMTGSVAVCLALCWSTAFQAGVISSVRVFALAT